MSAINVSTASSTKIADQQKKYKAKSTKTQALAVRQSAIDDHKNKYLAVDFTANQATCLAAEIVELQDICTENTTEQINSTIGNHNLATKADIAHFATKADSVIVNHKIDLVQKDIDLVRKDIDLVKIELEKQIIKSSKETILWLVGIIIVINGAMFAAIGAGFHWW